MPIDLDDNLVNAAIIEFHTAKDRGGSDVQAWAAAVSRVRHDVLTIAALTCEQESTRLSHRRDAAGAAAAHECGATIRRLY